MQLKNLLFSTFLLFAFANLSAQTPGSSYLIQFNDWLSKIAEKAYGNPHVYNQIIEGTNAKSLIDNSFRKITAANDLRLGQKVWIPNLADASSPATPPTEEKDGILVALPKTNCEIRVWYNYQVVAIGALNDKWLSDGIDLKTRAEKAYELRHNARVNARFMMQNPIEVKGLQARDLVKYGNPNGPTFDYLIKKNTDKGSSLEKAYQSIINSSSRVSTVYNKDCQ